MESQETLPGLGAIRRNKGQNETAILKTIEYLRKDNLLTEADEAFTTLLVSTAIGVDSINQEDKASGRAALSKTYFSMLDKLDALINERTGKSQEVLTPHGAIIELVS